jgi:Amt family ammonium transporter
VKRFLIALALGSALLGVSPAFAEDAAVAADAAAPALEAAPADAAPVDAAASAPAEATAEAAPAEEAKPAPERNKGDIAWMLTATIIVLFMTLPGVALFYGGMVRSKNMLSVLMQVFTVFCLVAVLWVVYGYSLAFTSNPSSALDPFVGGLSKVFMSGVTYDSWVETFSVNVQIPELLFAMFQATFAGITCALIVGAFAERMKFSAILLFTVIWFTFCYAPMAHMVWYWGGPSAYDAASGFLFGKGALDFAGGTVVHINAGIAGLVGAILVGKRLGYGKVAMAPHSLTMTLIGASILWVGWFGFNAGSNLEANSFVTVPFANTLFATAVAALAWTFVEWFHKGKPSLLGAVSGAIAGLVAITPACGWVGLNGALVIGLAGGVLCFFAVTWLKAKLGYDDSLDVFGVHAVGGIVGALLTGVFVNPAWGGMGVVDYSTFASTGAVGVVAYEFGAQMMAQFTGVVTAVIWSGVVAFIAFKIADIAIGLRVTEDQEREGLDLAEHGERAYTP